MRLGLRLRLTIGYTVLSTAVASALVAFVVLRLEAYLQAGLDRELARSSAYIARSAGESRARFRKASRTVLPPRGAAAQVVSPRGRVLRAYGDGAGARPLAPADARRAALAGDRRLLTVVLGDERRRFRAIVSPVEHLGRRHVLIVAESLRGVEDAVGRVLWPLLLAAPVALAATALGGSWLARRALLPVERMTSETESIGIEGLHARIAVPRAADEIGRLAVTLNALLDRLEQGVREKDRLIADASHQVRGPLAVMRAELDVSLRGDELSSAARAVLESTREEVDRMSRTVDNLLTLAQADEGRLEPLKARVVLDEAIESAARPLRALAAAKRMRLELAGAEGCEAQADPLALHQALTNLMENAIKFGRPGGEVRVTAWSRGGEVGVTVADDGPGIPVHARARVFDRFYRADPGGGGEAPGSGLGLAICREIAVAHGGRVWVESEERKGSAFSLALPRLPTAERGRPSDLEGGRASDPERPPAASLTGPST